MGIGTHRQLFADPGSPRLPEDSLWLEGGREGGGEGGEERDTQVQRETRREAGKVEDDELQASHYWKTGVPNYTLHESVVEVMTWNRRAGQMQSPPMQSPPFLADENSTHIHTPAPLPWYRTSSQPPVGVLRAIDYRVGA